MGYYTDFKLTCTNQEVLDSLMQEAKYDSYLSRFEKSNDGSYYCNCKWYEHEVELCNISKKYSDHLFVLDGNGEEPGDVWRKYFKNGLINDSILSYSSFDLSKLRSPKVM